MRISVVISYTYINSLKMVDKFPHITVQYDLLERNISFNFNLNRCKNAGLEEIPNSDNYELVKLRRIYHFNKDTPDHIIFTINEPILVLIYKTIDLHNSCNFLNGGYFIESEDDNTRQKNERFSNDRLNFTKKDKAEVIIKCIREGLPKKVNTPTKLPLDIHSYQINAIKDNNTPSRVICSNMTDTSGKSKVMSDNLFQSSTLSCRNDLYSNDNEEEIGIFDEDFENVTEDVTTYVNGITENKSVVEFNNVNEIIIDDTCHEETVPLQESTEYIYNNFKNLEHAELQNYVLYEDSVTKEHSYSARVNSPEIRFFHSVKDTSKTINNIASSEYEKNYRDFLETVIGKLIEVGSREISKTEKEEPVNNNKEESNKSKKCNLKVSLEQPIQAHTDVFLKSVCQQKSNAANEKELEVNSDLSRNICQDSVSNENTLSKTSVKNESTDQTNVNCSLSKDISQNSVNNENTVDNKKCVKDKEDNKGNILELVVDYYQDNDNTSINVNLSNQGSSVMKPLIKRLKLDNYNFLGFTKDEQQNKNLANILTIYNKHLKCLCEEIENNMETKGNGKTNLYKCSRCNFRVQKLSHLQMHLRSHIEPFWCNLCINMYSTASELQNHIKQYHDDGGKKPKKFTTQGKSFGSRIDTGEKPFKKGMVVEKDIYKCGFCNYSSSYIKRLRYHMKVHEKEKLYYCDECNFTTLTEWVMEGHMDKHETEQFECNECGYITMYKEEFNQHMQIHNRDNKFKCDKCSFSTSHLGYFNAHLSFHQPKIEPGLEPEPLVNKKTRKVYKCEKCSYITKQLPMLFRHDKKMHSDNKLLVKSLALYNDKDKFHMCKKCGFLCETWEQFQGHSVIHEDAKPYKCDLCDFITNTECSLKSHNKSHLEQEPFRCAVCNFKFLTLKELESHTKDFCSYMDSTKKRLFDANGNI